MPRPTPLVKAKFSEVGNEALIFFKHSPEAACNARIGRYHHKVTTKGRILVSRIMLYGTWNSDVDNGLSGQAQTVKRKTAFKEPHHSLSLKGIRVAGNQKQNRLF